MKSILTVCIGNICRSPMAEGMLASAITDIRVESAGIGALIGNPADPKAVELMARGGWDISSHIARQITQALCQRAEIILVMDQQQRRFIESRYPFTRGKVFRIAEGIGRDIPDPYKKDQVAFENAFELIQQGVDIWINRIKKIKVIERN